MCVIKLTSITSLEMVYFSCFLCSDRAIHEEGNVIKYRERLCRPVTTVISSKSSWVAQKSVQFKSLTGRWPVNLRSPAFHIRTGFLKKCGEKNNDNETNNNGKCYDDNLVVALPKAYDGAEISRFDEESSLCSRWFLRILFRWFLWKGWPRVCRFGWLSSAASPVVSLRLRPRRPSTASSPTSAATTLTPSNPGLYGKRKHVFCPFPIFVFYFRQTSA